MIPSEFHDEEEKPLNSVPHLCPALYLYLCMLLRHLYSLSRDILEHLCHTVGIKNYLHSRFSSDNPVDKLDIKEIAKNTKCLNSVLDWLGCIVELILNHEAVILQMLELKQVGKEELHQASTM